MRELLLSSPSIRRRLRIERHRCAAIDTRIIDYFPTPYCLNLTSSGPWPNIYPIAACLYSGSKGESAIKKAKIRIEKYRIIPQAGSCFDVFDARASRVSWLPFSTPFNVASDIFSARSTTSIVVKLPKQGRVNGLSEPFPDAPLFRGFLFPIHSGIFRKN